MRQQIYKEFSPYQIDINYHAECESYLYQMRGEVRNHLIEILLEMQIYSYQIYKFAWIVGEASEPIIC